MCPLTPARRFTLRLAATVAVQRTSSTFLKPESVANALQRPGRSDRSMNRRSLLTVFRFAAPTRVDSRSCCAREYRSPTRSLLVQTAPFRHAQPLRLPWLRWRADLRRSPSVVFPSKTPSLATPTVFPWLTAPRPPSSLSPAVTSAQTTPGGMFGGFRL